MKSKFTKEQEKEITFRYVNGEKSTNLAKEFKCHYVTILNIVKRNNEKVKNNSEAHSIYSVNSKILAKIPTKSGWHLITKPFNLQQFKQQYSNIEVQKNNPTLLYFEYED